MPFLRILVLAFALMHAVGVSDALDMVCEDECADASDCGDDGCPPIFLTCHCAPCPPAIPAQVATAVAVEPQPVVATFARLDEAVGGPDPREILHVPIALRV